MQAISKIRFGLQINQINLQEKPNKQQSNLQPHSQPMKDLVSFGSSKPNGINAFLTQYRSIFENIKFHKDGDYYFSKEIGFAESKKIAGAYIEKMNQTLIGIIEDAEPTKSGVKSFVKKLLSHRKEYPFSVEPFNDQICIEKHSSVLAGQPDLSYSGSQIISEYNPKLADYIVKNGLGGNDIEHEGGHYLVNPVLTGFDGDILIGVNARKNIRI